MSTAAPRPDTPPSFGQLARAFFTLGCIGFGGPIAHVALIQREIVDRRGWLTAQQVVEGLALAQILPGPVSTELAIYAGYRIRHYAGGLVSGAAFILPAFVLLMGLTWAYFRYGAIGAVQSLFAGMAPAVLAMILVSGYSLMRNVARTWVLRIIMLASAAAVGILRVNVLAIFVLAAVAGLMLYGPLQGVSPRRLAALAWPILGHLAVYFLKVGAFIFGGGLVIVPMIEQEVVNKYGWLTRREFLDGLALGQITPGPVVITATFIGYRVAGVAGALVSTVAIFLPSFVLIFLAASSLRRVEHSPYVRAMLTTLNPAATGAIFGSFISLSQGLLSAPLEIILFVLALIALLRFRISFPVILAATACMGWAAHGLL